jgi:hypothetical protein
VRMTARRVRAGGGPTTPGLFGPYPIPVSATPASINIAPPFSQWESFDLNSGQHDQPATYVSSNNNLRTLESLELSKRASKTINSNLNDISPTCDSIYHNGPEPLYSNIPISTTFITNSSDGLFASEDISKESITPHILCPSALDSASFANSDLGCDFYRGGSGAQLSNIPTQSFDSLLSTATSLEFSGFNVFGDQSESFESWLRSPAETHPGRFNCQSMDGFTSLDMALMKNSNFVRDPHGLLSNNETVQMDLDIHKSLPCPDRQGNHGLRVSHWFSDFKIKSNSYRFTSRITHHSSLWCCLSLTC